MILVDTCRVYRGHVAAREAAAECTTDMKVITLQDKPVQAVSSASRLKFK